MSLSPEEKPKPHLTDFVDVETLQTLQDGFARVVNVATSIRDAEGDLVTEPSLTSTLCRILRKSARFSDLCRQSHLQHGKAGAGGAASLCICHAGLAQYAAPIEVEGERLGTIVIGDRPHHRLTAEEIHELATTYGTDEAELKSVADRMIPWDDEEMQSAIHLLRLIANTIARLCWQQYELRHQLDNVTALQSVAGLVSSGKARDEVLALIAQTLVASMKVTGCTLRMLDNDQEELVARAVAGLSQRYLGKGSVLVEKSHLDQLALSGELVRIENMQSDPRVLYSEEAREEGLVSALVAGLFFNQQPLGTVHIYTNEKHKFTYEEEQLFLALASQAANAIANARLQAEQIEKVRIERQLKMAAEVQRRMIPDSPPQFAEFDIAGLYRPSQQLGGDFYDFLPLAEQNLGIAIGDVVGKGVPAALLMSSVRTSLRAHAAYQYQIDHVVEQVNRTMCSDTLIGEFVTLFYGVINAPRMRLTYCNAGHDPPLLIRDNKIVPLDVGGMVVGVDADTTYEMGIVHLQPGDVILLYTDGVVDAMDYDGESFGRDRLKLSALAHCNKPASKIVMNLLWDVRRFSGIQRRTDDLTVVAIRIPPADGD